MNEPATLDHKKGFGDGWIAVRESCRRGSLEAGFQFSRKPVGSKRPVCLMLSLSLVLSLPYLDGRISPMRHYMGS
jgi:hypothetical protein